MFMWTAAWLAQPWWEYAFLSDDSPVSWLSGALLLANAVAALGLTLSGSLPPASGSLLSFALMVLALDEQFLLHERFKEIVPAGLGNAPVFAIGSGGLLVLIVLGRAVRPRAARALLQAAVAMGLFALWVDVGHPPALIAQLEEGFEVIAEALFLSGLLEISRGQVQSAS